MKSENNPSETAAHRSEELRHVRVWDVPTRLFHWALVLLVAFSLYLGNVGGTWEMEWHMLSGYAILVLVLFRIAWGFFGSRRSRFSDFVRGPAAAFAYLKSQFGPRPNPSIGHNPLGGWSVVALLTCLLVQAGTGLFANDDILTEGPLMRYVSKATSNRLTEVHEFSATILYGLIALHVSVVLAYLWIKKENLIRPMITGWKAWPARFASGEDSAFVNPLWAAAVLAAASSVVWLIVTW